MIKLIGETAREDLSKIAGAKVHLFLFVKVKKDWMHDLETYERADVPNLIRKS